MFIRNGYNNGNYLRKTKEYKNIEKIKYPWFTADRDKFVKKHAIIAGARIVQKQRDGFIFIFQYI